MKLIVFLALLLPAVAWAVPATFDTNIAPTFSQPANGPPSGYKLYSVCDVPTGSKGALEDGAYTSGKNISVTGDTDNPPALCVVAFNTSGDGVFDAVINISGPPPPGAVVNLQVGDCTVTLSTGEQYPCSITISN